MGRGEERRHAVEREGVGRGLKEVILISHMYFSLKFFVK